MFRVYTSMYVYIIYIIVNDKKMKLASIGDKGVVPHPFRFCQEEYRIPKWWLEYIAFPQFLYAFLFFFSSIYIYIYIDFASRLKIGANDHKRMRYAMYKTSRG